MTGDGTCDVEFLAFVVEQAGQNVNNYGPCLRAWIQAASEHDHAYGSQLGSDTAEKAFYEDVVKEAIERGRDKPDGFYHDYGQDVGVDIDTGKVTSIVRVDGVTDEAHIIPVNEMP
jgi:hypothetical protein